MESKEVEKPRVRDRFKGTPLKLPFVFPCSSGCDPSIESSPSRALLFLPPPRPVCSMMHGIIPRWMLTSTSQEKEKEWRETISDLSVDVDKANWSPVPSVGLLFRPGPVEAHARFHLFSARPVHEPVYDVWHFNRPESQVDQISLNSQTPSQLTRRGTACSYMLSLASAIPLL